MLDIAVVGGGLFGSIIARAFEGRNVAVFDDAQPTAGSRPAACLLKPSWYSSLGKEVYQPALKLLDEFYGVADLRFATRLGKVVVHWCDPKQILQPPTHRVRVSSVTRRNDSFVVRADKEYLAKTVIVTAGIWTPLLVPMLGTRLIGQAGVAFLWPEETVEKPFIKVWAPYRQLVVFNRGDGVWAGDGTAIRAENWSAKYDNACAVRCSTAFPAKSERRRLFGVRPYANVSPCYLKEHSPGLWVATGGAKNGTIAAGWCADQLRKRL